MSFVSDSVYPFAALCGQERMRLALVLAAIDPAIGGVLIRGEKGTAKSTAARGLAALLPRLAEGRAAPFVDLPLGATEDRVIGSIDLEAALAEGRARFQPGLLARADQGILYIDEVNLLDDHLVESILDVAASGVNRVEREGQSLVHPARITLIGTMNPEEGDLRPQLLDRFGLAVAVSGESDPAIRVALMRARESFEQDGTAFAQGWAEAQAVLAGRIVRARAALPQITLPRPMQGFIAEICRRNHVAGHRADLAIARAARAHAAWDGRDIVTAEDVTEVAPFALLHRMRGATPDLPPPPPPSEDPEESDQDGESESAPNSDGSEEQEESGAGEGDDAAPPPSDAESAEQAPGPAGDDGDVQSIGTPFTPRPLGSEPRDALLRTGSGRRARSLSASRQGRMVASTPLRERDDIAFDATLRAAAPHQLRRRDEGPGLAIRIRPEDIREKRRERRVGSFLLFVVDGSGSMGAHRRMVETKAAILSLLLDAYQKRDRVAMVVFRGTGAETVLPPTGSVERAARLLADLPVGGRTPLSAGLVEAARLLDRVGRRDPATRPLVLVLTDGRANAGLGGGPPHEEALRLAAALGQRFAAARFIVIDTEPPGLIRLDLAGRLAAALAAPCLRTEDLRAEDLRAEDLVHFAKEFQP
ncbi:VWA domain-containing protein [Magnetospirillum fulvum]|uniref:Magnesium chelatase n=1 Tax=Magnetospirillum fulvum MGU-K5 TaxID=1316936 RepID=S9S7F5_MAGFU|nr:VWA domain-containing protein [Magnetospirillum fulvum]EPY01832.1 magnesium chelatase [Magnetospirillum fulvum MGU-K5]